MKNLDDVELEALLDQDLCQEWTEYQQLLDLNSCQSQEELQNHWK